MLLFASRQLDTITSGKRDCWEDRGVRGDPRGAQGPRGASRSLRALLRQPRTALLLKSSYLAKFLRKTKQLLAPGGQELCTSTTDSWSSRHRSVGGNGAQRGGWGGHPAPHRATPCRAVPAAHLGRGAGAAPPGPSCGPAAPASSAPASRRAAAPWSPPTPPASGTRRLHQTPSPPAGAGVRAPSGRGHRVPHGQVPPTPAPCPPTHMGGAFAGGPLPQGWAAEDGRVGGAAELGEGVGDAGQRRGARLLLRQLPAAGREGLSSLGPPSTGSHAPIPTPISTGEPRHPGPPPTCCRG